MGRADATALIRLRILDRLGVEIGRAVTDLYTQVAAAPAQGFHFPTGRAAALLAGYTEDLLAPVPPEVLERFAGVGCPLRHAPPQEGDAVLDLGCGAGTDIFIAAAAVGPQGRVLGIDLTEHMLDAARTALKAQGIGHVTVRHGRAPQLPHDDTFDLVTSNGVLNLVPNKEATLDRLYALLRPGGRLTLADIALRHPPADACLADASLWAECLVGAYTATDYLDALEAAGFDDVHVHHKRDYFQHSDSAKTRDTAASLGAFAWDITARKPE